MDWHLRGFMTETCNCNAFCPCWYQVKELQLMDGGYCAGSLLVQVEDGASDGVDLTGCTVALIADWPGPTQFDGNGTARVYVDEAASEEQARELIAIFQGEKGGPMEFFRPIISTWLPAQTTSIRTSRDGDVITAAIGSVGDVTSRAIRDADGRGFTMRGGGSMYVLGMDEVEMATTVGTTWSDPDMPHRFETRSGGRGMINWSSSGRETQASWVR